MFSYTNDIEEAWNVFKNTVVTAIAKFVPKSFICKRVNPKYIKRAINNKRYYWSLFKRTKSLHYKEKYLFFSHYVKTLITEYEHFKLTSLCRNKISKLFYTYVNKKLNRVYTSIKLKNTVNGSYLSDTEACKVFAEFFYSTFTKSDGVLPPFEEQCDLKIDDFCFDISKLDKYLQKLPAKSPCGPDSIPSVFLKKLHSS